MDMRTFSCALLLATLMPLSAKASSKLYIVYLGEKEHDDPSMITASHHDMLTSVFGSKDEAKKSMVYSYKHGFSGFAATLTETQAEILAEFPEVVRVKLNTYHKPHTTQSWDFLGLDYDGPQQQEGLLQRAKYGENIIIGVIDSGIWPESRSFDDTGYSPVPARWRGVCQIGHAWNATSCNRKIIGARWYSGGISADVLKMDYNSPRDLTGHGTHVASTIAGSQVWNVSHRGGGLGVGIARGGAPRSRLAIYKVCWIDGSCPEAAILAAIDDAIKDGVDVLSLSLGGSPGEEIFQTLHAVLQGISVVFAGGNGGPVPQMVLNVVPWVMTVAASTIDRSFPTQVTLGNNEKLVSWFYDHHYQRMIYLDLNQAFFFIISTQPQIVGGHSGLIPPGAKPHSGLILHKEGNYGACTNSGLLYTLKLGRQSKPFKDPITHRHIHKGSSFLLVRELTQREIMILRGTKVNKENLTIESVQKQLSLNSEGQSLHYNASVISNDFKALVHARSCDMETLASSNVTGKIVLCYAPEEAFLTSPRVALRNAINRTLEAGAKGLIFAQYSVNNVNSVATCHNIMPCVLVDFEVAHRIASYWDMTGSPVVKVSPTMSAVGNEVLSPRVASFSSRGPSLAFSAILKPDIAAPGVNILAAVRGTYVLLSGTSMACPHVSAVTALLKSVHPNWSPAMIKSAIITTASVTDRFGMPIQAEGVPRKLADPFDFGGGQIDPDRADDPGLVYDVDAKEYNKFFNCTLGLLDGCESYQLNLNLPSIAVPNLKDNVTVSRTVTNVGPVEATYRVVVEAPAGVAVIIPFIYFFCDAKCSSVEIK
ncbi:subtilisin-like protease SBT3.9 isoform X2 [Triticum dicoccoides]|uniref:subtilisin-like protease SBT3.9 isoform X2 n=1 Tax=Triticum dicoccoides TaxID=85692 RepID=UPI001890C107|nr:subtilisin-like protease SBT3.9 isoform X2 [Triticum dicoccoides]